MHITSFWSKGCLALFAAAFFLALGMVSTGGAVTERYVGSEACGDCHEVEYDSFYTHSSKAHSGKSVQVMMKDLTPQELIQCYECHVTGYGKPGGFVSFEETPGLADVGCETCHGPGYDHVESGGELELIKYDLDVADCEQCHNADRVTPYNYKPMLFAAAH